jgi:hypothetical protein
MDGNRPSLSAAARRFRLSMSLFAVLVMCFAAQAQTITLRGRVSPSTIANTWRYSDLYAEGNIAVLGTYNARGAYIFDISNPDNPVLASWYNPTPAQQMLEAVVRNGIGYFGSGNSGGVHVVNLADPYNPVFITAINASNGGGYNTIHEIVIEGNYLFETDSRTPTIKVINITNPAAPVFVRNIVTTDSLFIHAVHIANGRLFASGWGGKTEIFDVSNVGTAAPLLGTVAGGTNAHSTWTSVDGNYLYSCRELVDGDLRVYNITDPANPTLVKSIKAADLGLNAICPHNPVVYGNLLFVAWYQAGLQVFDISDPANPVRVGQYDTFSPAFVRTAEMERASNEPWDMVCGFDGLVRSVPGNYDGNWSVFPFLGLNKVLVGDLSGGLFIVDASRALMTARNHVADFDGDGKTNISQFRSSTGTWYTSTDPSTNFGAMQFGLATDRIAPADYDGDGKTDIAVFRPSEGVWYMQQTSAGFKAVQWGTNGDIPVPGDFDADGRADIGVFRPSTGSWYISQSTLGFTSRQWGTVNDMPVLGDYDGDGKTDMGVFRPSNSSWYILQSSSSIALTRQFGLGGDRPLIGDFDGDDHSDFAVFRPSEGAWYMIRSSNNAFFGQQFGLNGDMPVEGDYDGDGLTDLAVYRPSASSWYLLKSSNGAFEAMQFGAASDLPVPSVYNPQ